MKKQWTDQYNAEHNAERAEKVDDKLEHLRMLKAENPKASQRKLAEMMGISAMYVSKLMKKL